MPTLAQQLGNLQQVLDVPEPPALPAPPAWEVHLLEAPLLPALLLGLVGVVALAWLWSRGDRRRAGMIGGGVLALAGAWWSLGTLVETPRERVEAAARALVLAVAKNDQASLGLGLDPSCVLYAYFAPGGIGKDAILQRVEAMLGSTGQFRVTGLTIEQVQRSVSEGTGGRTAQVQIKVRVSTSASDFPNRSWWRLDYALSKDGVWRATGIMPLSIQGRPDASGR
jgi:hypothetical protein